MAVHQELLGRVERRLAEAEAAPLSKESAEDRMLLVSFTLHCADLCNPVLPPVMSRRIAESLGVEFDRQAQREREQGLQVTVMLANNELKKGEEEPRALPDVHRPLLCRGGICGSELVRRCIREVFVGHVSQPHVI